MDEFISSMKILEVCKISPANSPSQFSLPLTFLDMFWLPLDPTSRLFFYKFQEPNTDFLNILLPKIIDSLSLTLQHFLPVAGNLTWPKDSNKPIIQYQLGDGVSLTIAETLADFQTLSGDDFRKSVELWHLLPDFPSSETFTPLMTLKITLFPKIGFSIGYVAHHAVLDGKSVSLFLHSWAYICKNGDGSFLPSHLKPFLDRSFVKQQNDLEKVYPLGLGRNENLENKVLTKYETMPSPDTMLGTFKLTRENINYLRKLIISYREEKNKLDCVTRISSFTIASAYVFICLVKALEIQVEKTFIGINVDARARLDPPIHSTYFGNCILGCGGGHYTKELLSKDGFFLAVEIVTESLVSLNEGPIKIAGKLEKLLHSMFMEFEGFFIAGSPRFELYNVDFGWGKPIKMEMISIAKTSAKISTFALSDDRDNNGGIEIGVALGRHKAELFTSIFSNGLVGC